MLTKATCSTGQGFVQLKCRCGFSVLAGSPVRGRNEELRILSALLLTAPQTRAEWHTLAQSESRSELSITAADTAPDINCKRNQM